MMKGWTPESERQRMRAYRATEKGKAAAKAYRQSAKGKASDRRYRQGKRYEAKMARYRTSEKGRRNYQWQRDRRIHACGGYRGRAATPALAAAIRKQVQVMRLAFRAQKRREAQHASLAR